jgi:hypothetical protein
MRTTTQRPQGSQEPLLIVAAAAEDPPFPVDAMVIEEDTYLVLSPPDEVIEKPTETFAQLLNKTSEILPISPGTILTKKGKPHQFLAVIHDLDRDPSWREEWIAQAFFKIFQEVDSLSLVTLGTPLLGTVHGTLAVERAYDLLRQALDQVRPGALKSIWLVTTPEPHDIIYRMPD